MTEMQSAVGRIQLRRLTDWVKSRNKHAETLSQTCRKFNCFRVPKIPENITHAFYKLYIFVKPEQLKEGWTRDRIMAEINALGIPCLSGSCSEIYLEKAFDGTGFRPKERLPAAKLLGETSLMFLVHPSLKDSEIKVFCEAIDSVAIQACC
jgi:dTDP-4-amino-4,6-dideoxygalactose transaminase